MTKVSIFFIYFLLLWTRIQSQEAPFYTYGKFTPVSYRQNVCDRQRSIFLDEIQLPEALQGLNLSVVVTNYKDNGSKPFFALNEEGVIDEYKPGLFSIIMDELALRAGFTWRDSYGVVDPIDSTVDGNRTWSDLLEWEIKTYDVALGKWDRSLDRIKREINFPEGWYDASYILVEAREGSKSLNIWSFLLPFQWEVWLLIAATVIATGLLYFLLDKMNNDSDEMELDRRPGDAVFYSFLTMTGHFELHPVTTSARLLTFSLTFFALLVVSAYTANLVSFLVVRNTPKFTVTSIQEAVRLGVPVCVQDGVAMDDYLSEEYPHGRFVRRSTELEVFLALHSEECQVAAVPQSSFDFYRRNSLTNGDCSLAWYGRVERIVPSGLATIVDNGILCTSLIGAVLDYHLLEMKTDGFLERAWEEHLERVGDLYCPRTSDAASGDVNLSKDEDTESLGIQELAGIFIIHLAMSALSIVLAFCMYLWHQHLNPNKNHLKHFPETTSDLEPEDDSNESFIPPSQLSDEIIDDTESLMPTDNPEGRSNGKGGDHLEHVA